MAEWISATEAAAILGVGRTTVYRSLADPEQRAQTWGVEGVGWRHKPLSTRGIFQVSRARAAELASRGGDPRTD